MKKQKIYLFTAIIAIIAIFSLLPGCSTPQERSGVSPIPFNSPDPSDSNPFGVTF